MFSEAFVCPQRGRLCPGWGVSVQEGSLSRWGVSLSRWGEVSVQVGGLCPGGSVTETPPPLRWKSGWYASYWINLSLKYVFWYSFTNIFLFTKSLRCDVLVLSTAYTSVSPADICLRTTPLGGGTWYQHVPVGLEFVTPSLYQAEPSRPVAHTRKCPPTLTEDIGWSVGTWIQDMPWNQVNFSQKITLGTTSSNLKCFSLGFYCS